MNSTNEPVPFGAANKHVTLQIDMPDGTPEFMGPAYFGCLRWALASDIILNQFESATGKSFSPARTGIEKLLDEATGFDPCEDFIRAFVPWFNENVWGNMDGPGEK